MRTDRVLMTTGMLPRGFVCSEGRVWSGGMTIEERQIIIRGHGHPGPTRLRTCVEGTNGHGPEQAELSPRRRVTGSRSLD